MATPEGGWRAFLAGLAPICEDGLPRLRPAGPGATEEALASLESTLGVALPADLRDLLAEMDGVHDEAAYLLLVMSIDNSLFFNRGIDNPEEGWDWPPAVPYGRQLIFAGWGNGDLLGFAIKDGVVRDDLILEFDHERGEVAPYTTSLQEFFVRYVNW